MSLRALIDVTTKLMSDGDYRNLLVNEPDEALGPFDLTPGGVTGDAPARWIAVRRPCGVDGTLGSPRSAERGSFDRPDGRPVQCGAKITIIRGVAQIGSAWDAEVGGSNPLAPTNRQARTESAGLSIFPFRVPCEPDRGVTGVDPAKAMIQPGRKSSGKSAGAVTHHNRGRSRMRRSR